MCNLSQFDLFWDVTEICNKKKSSDQQLVMEKELVKNMGVLKLRKMESTFLAEQAAISN